MGIYVMFWHAPPDGLPTHFLQLPHDEIEVWLRHAMEDFPEDFDPRILPLLQDVRRRGAVALEASNEEQASLVDELLGVCYGIWNPGNDSKPTMESADENLLRLERFKSFSDESTKRGTEIPKPWLFVFSGRPIFRDPERLPFQSKDGGHHLAYWTANEISQLLPWVENLQGVNEAAQGATLTALKSAQARQGGLILTVG